jgi:cobalt/nickel transport system permease protein
MKAAVRPWSGPEGKVQVRFALTPARDSPLARIDARWRLAGLLAILAAAAAVRTGGGALLALAAALVLAALARMDWDWYAGRLLLVAAFLAAFVVPVPFLARMGWAEGALLAGVLLLKALALFTLAAVLLVTAPVEVTLKAAHGLRLPGLLTQLLLLSYRYLFVLGDELARLRIALRVRGFRNRPNRHSYRTVAAAAGTLVVRGHERGERIAAAMRCRGFDGRFRALVGFRTRAGDVLATAGMAAASAGLLGLDWYWRS